MDSVSCELDVDVVCRLELSVVELDTPLRTSLAATFETCDSGSSNSDSLSLGANCSEISC